MTQNFNLNKKKKILVTGGSGFIGSNIILRLLELGFFVICLDIKRPKNIKLQKRFKFLKGSILDKNAINKAINGCNVIIHLAATLGVENTDQNILRCLEINAIGTKNILNIAKNKNIKKFIYASSSEVYGDQKIFPINENAELKNKSIYAISKIVSEKYVIGYHEKYKLNYNIIRFFNVYGEGQLNNFVIPKFINSAKKNISLKVFGDGKQVRSFCDVRDATNGLIEILKSGKTNKTYNVGNDLEPISIYGLAKKVVKLSKKKLKIKKIPYSKSDRKKSREIIKRIPDISRIQKDTKYKPTVSIEQGIIDLLKLK